MKKILVLPLVLFSFALDAAEESNPWNPFFGEYRNQAMFNLGQGVNSFGLIPMPDMPVPFNMLQFAYSQPTTFFRLPARRTFSFIKTIGYGKKYYYEGAVFQGRTWSGEWDWQKYATEIMSLSMDFIPFHGERWYYGLGLSINVQGRQNERMGTKLFTGFKMIFGYRIAKRWNAEMFVQHYSNGDTGGDANYSYNFWGLGVGYNF